MRQETAIDEAVSALAEIHADRIASLSRWQLAIERTIDAIGRPWFAVAVLAFVFLWIAVAAALRSRGLHAFDEQSYPWLSLIVTIGSFVMTVLILIAENRQGEMDERRSQATLQFALVIEQKVAKVIELLEAMREDDPHLSARPDEQAQKMAKPTDVRQAVERLEQAQERALDERGVPPV